MILVIRLFAKILSIISASENIIEERIINLLGFIKSNKLVNALISEWQFFLWIVVLCVLIPLVLILYWCDMYWNSYFKTGMVYIYNVNLVKTNTVYSVLDLFFYWCLSSFYVYPYRFSFSFWYIILQRRNFVLRISFTPQKIDTSVPLIY